MENKKELQRFNPDRPIESISQDTLGRSDFAEALAHRIAAWQNRDSLVLALYGPWGSGKSSVKNLIKEYLQKVDSEIPVVEFNPWHVSGQEQLITAFFEEVGKALPRDEQTAGKKRASLWREYGGHFAAASKIAHALKYAAPLLPVPYLSDFFEQLSKALAEAGTLAGEGARASTIEKGLDQLKKALSDELAKLPRPVLIVIDDIDRLEKDEIRQLFRVVKGNADFPNFVYLLLFQRDLVERALKGDGNEEGRLYLEKIVQVGLPLPQPPLNNIHNTVFDGLNRMLGSLERDAEKCWQEERWANLWITGLSHYFSNLRRAYRYLNSLDFMFGMLRRKQTLEVNPMDLVALECIRVFEPNVYAAVQEAKKLLTTTNTENSEHERLQSDLDALVEPAINKKAAKAIILDLFPVAKEIWTRWSYGDGYMRRWQSERRACCSDFFDRYFQLAVPEGQVSEADIESVMASLCNRDALREKFRGFINSGTLAAALQRLEAEETLDKQENPAPYLLAWSDVADEFPAKNISLGMISVSPRQFVRWAVFRALGNIKEHGAKVALAQSFIGDSAGLLLPVEILDALLRRKDEDTDLPKIDAETAELLRHQCLQRLAKAAASGALINHRELTSLLYCWLDWDANATKLACERWLDNPEDASRLLAALVRRGTSQAVGSYYVKEERFVELRQLEQFASLEKWKAAVDTMNGKTSKDKDLQRAVLDFHKALKRREKGLPDQTRGGEE